MQKRKLGKSNLEVSAIGFGCTGLNFSYGHSLTPRVMLLSRRKHEPNKSRSAGDKRPRPPRCGRPKWRLNLAISASAESSSSNTSLGVALMRPGMALSLAHEPQ